MCCDAGVGFPYVCIYRDFLVLDLRAYFGVKVFLSVKDEFWQDAAYVNVWVPVVVLYETGGLHLECGFVQDVLPVVGQQIVQLYLRR